MHGILTFSSIFLGMALTLLFGPQWGIMMGLLAYLAGSSTLHSRELVKLKMEFQQRMNELPEMVNELVEQKLKTMSPAKAPAPAPAGDAPFEAPVPTPAPTDPGVLDERFTALDHKLSALVDLLVAREAKAPDTHPVAVKTDDAPPAKAETHTETEPVAPEAAQGPSSPPDTQASPMSEAGAADEHTGKDHEAELAAMRELVEKMATMLAMQGGSQEAGDRESTPAKAAPSSGGTATAQRPSFQHLREELDKIAHEVRSELGRPSAK